MLQISKAIQEVSEQDIMEFFNRVPGGGYGVVIHILKRIGSTGEQVLPRELIQRAINLPLAGSDDEERQEEERERQLLERALVRATR